MSALDQILAKTMQLRGAGVLFVVRKPIHYQKGCGVGRRQYSESVLLVHPKDSDRIGTWALPDADVAPEECLDSAVPLGDVLLARCDAEFKPVVDMEKVDVEWVGADFAITCTKATDPDAIAAIQQFLADAGEPALQQKGAMTMESRISPREAQQKAQRVHEAFGDAEGAPAILNGETEIDYRVRLVSKFQQHSKVFKDSNLARIAAADAATLTAIENQIYADAATALSDPSTFAPGELRAIVTRDPSGREITRYVGDPDACWAQFNPPRRFVRRILTPGTATVN